MFALAWQEVKECKRIYVQTYRHAYMHTYIDMYKWLWSNGSPVHTEISAIKMSFARGRRQKEKGMQRKIPLKRLYYFILSDSVCACAVMSC